MVIQLNRKHFAALAVVAAAPWLIAASIEAATGEDNNTRVDIVGYGTAPQEVRLLTMSAGVETFATSASRAMADNAGTVAGIRRALGALRHRSQGRAHRPAQSEPKHPPGRSQSRPLDQGLHCHPFGVDPVPRRRQGGRRDGHIGRRGRHPDQRPRFLARSHARGTGPPRASRRSAMPNSARNSMPGRWA